MIIWVRAAGNKQAVSDYKKGCCFLELLPAGMGMMLFLWDPVKTKMMVKFQDYCLAELQIVSE